MTFSKVYATITDKNHEPRNAEWEKFRMRVRITDSRKRIVKGGRNPRSISRELAAMMVKARGGRKGILDTREKLIAAGLIVREGVEK